VDSNQQVVRPNLAEFSSRKNAQTQLEQELKQSAIKPGIARLNFIPVAPFTPSPYDEVISEGKQLILGHWLEKKNQQKKYPNHYQQVTTEIERVLRTYNHLDEGGWYCGGGYNPLTKKSQDWGCLKPNTPRLSGEYEKKADGKWHKVIKYESPLGQDLGLFLLKLTYRTARKLAKKNHELKSFETFFGKAYDINGENYKLDDECLGFWEWVIACPSLIIYLTEGAKKAACLLSQGYCAIGASGIWGFYRTKASNGEKVEPYLHPLLTRFVKKQRHFYFAFDSDNPDEKPETVKQVNLAIGKTGRLLRKTKGVKTYIIHWNHELGKGVDDLIFNHGIGAFQQAVENRINILTNTWLNSKKLSDITVTVNQRYLDCELPPPEKYSIIQIRGNQGTGKTVTIAKALAKLASNEYQILLPTHRETLAR
jgi:Domain of unknown function (DUF3854)